MVKNVNIRSEIVERTTIIIIKHSITNILRKLGTENIIQMYIENI